MLKNEKNILPNNLDPGLSMWRSLQVQTDFIVEEVLSTKGYIFLP